MKRFRRLASVVLALTLVVGMSSTLACTSTGVGKDATADGSVMISHTCDGWYDNRIVVVPGGTHAEGEMVEIYNDPCYATMPGMEAVKVGEIPQAAETYTYFNIAYPFMNEKQIMIGEHTWSGRDEMYSTKGLFVIANLEMLGLQRAATARDFIKTIGALAEQYGYCDGGECLIIGDTEEAWVFEICGGGTTWTPESGRPGAHWVAKRIPDDEAFVGANRSRTGVIDFNDTENTMWSTDITKLPEEMGWWKQGEEFDFSKLFDPRESPTSFNCSRREWRVFSLMAPSLDLPIYDNASDKQYPFTIKPDTKLTPRDIMTIYSDHYEGTDYDMTTGLAAGPFHSPVRWSVKNDQKTDETAGTPYGFEREIAINGCSYSFVSQSRSWLPDPVGGVLWFGEDAPDTTVYVPVYCGTTEVPEAWSSGLRHKFDPDSAWWAFNFVNNWANLRWDAMYKDIREKKASYEDTFFADQDKIEAEAAALFEQDPAKAVEYVTKYTNDNMNMVFDGWWDFAWQLVGSYYDGRQLDADGANTNLGYPKDWLEQVDFGGPMLRDAAMLAGETAEPEPTAEPTAAPSTPAPTAAPTAAPEAPAQSSNTALIVVIVVIAIIAIGAGVYFATKKRNNGGESK